MSAEPPDRAGGRFRRANRDPRWVRAIRNTRELLPGDENLGDALSTAGDRPSDVIARHLAERGAGETAAHEAGLAAIQVWQALSRKTGRGSGTVDATILFTDLVDFSSWVLEAGDEQALELLRAVAEVVEPAIASHRGQVVKRLGDGHMAVFTDPRAGVDAALSIQEELAEVEVGGHRPRLRAGLHLGRPRKLGGDYLGTDVNIAARVGAAARAGEVLVSDTVLEAIDTDGLRVKRMRGFRAKGAPRDLEVFRVSPAAR
jgi:adenylate cyclase